MSEGKGEQKERKLGLQEGEELFEKSQKSQSQEPFVPKPRKGKRSKGKKKKGGKKHPWEDQPWNTMKYDFNIQYNSRPGAPERLYGPIDRNDPAFFVQDFEVYEQGINFSQKPNSPYRVWKEGYPRNIWMTGRRRFRHDPMHNPIHLRRGAQQLVCERCRWVSGGYRCRNLAACRMPMYPCIGEHAYCRRHAKRMWLNIRTGELRKGGIVQPPGARREWVNLFHSGQGCVVPFKGKEGHPGGPDFDYKPYLPPEEEEEEKPAPKTYAEIMKPFEPIFARGFPEDEKANARELEDFKRELLRQEPGRRRHVIEKKRTPGPLEMKVNMYWEMMERIKPLSPLEELQRKIDLWVAKEAQQVSSCSAVYGEGERHARACDFPQAHLVFRADGYIRPGQLEIIREIIPQEILDDLDALETKTHVAKIRNRQKTIEYEVGAGESEEMKQETVEQLVVIMKPKEKEEEKEKEKEQEYEAELPPIDGDGGPHEGDEGEEKEKEKEKKKPPELERGPVIIEEILPLSEEKKKEPSQRPFVTPRFRRLLNGGEASDCLPWPGGREYGNSGWAYWRGEQSAWQVELNPERKRNPRTRRMETFATRKRYQDLLTDRANVVLFVFGTNKALKKSMNTAVANGPCISAEEQELLAEERKEAKREKKKKKPREGKEEKVEQPGPALPPPPVSTRPKRTIKKRAPGGGRSTGPAGRHRSLPRRPSYRQTRHRSHSHRSRSRSRKRRHRSHRSRSRSRRRR